MDFAHHPDPPAILWEAKKPKTKRRRKAALYIGAILILPDGTACRIVGFDQRGRPLCAPKER